MSKRELDRQAKKFLNYFPGQNSFAVKSNPHPEVLSHLHHCGASVFDVASLTEVASGREAAPGAVIHYHNPVRSITEMRRLPISNLAATGLYLPIKAIWNVSALLFVILAEVITKAHGLGYAAGINFRAGSLTTEIKAVLADRRELFLNNGIYGCFMEVYHVPALRTLVNVRSAGNEPQALSQWTVYGPTCDPIDVLPFEPMLSADIQPGMELYFQRSEPTPPPRQPGLLDMGTSRL